MTLGGSKPTRNPDGTLVGSTGIFSGMEQWMTKEQRDASVLPMVVDNGEVTVCGIISGGADEVGGMPCRLSLIRWRPDGTEVRADYVQKGPDWEVMARALWSLLDDISTLGDQHHPASTPYTKAVDRMCEKRCEHMYSPDGYKLEVVDKT